LKQIVALIRKEFLLEWRQKHTLFGILLYISCTVFAIYMMAGQPEGRVWNVLFWLGQLFVTLNAMAKSFLQEGEERGRYYFTIVSPARFMLAKMIYGVVMMLLLTLLALGLFVVLLGNPISHFDRFALAGCSGAVALSVLFTFLSAVAARARQSAALMAVMGFPIAIPLLMILSRLTLSSVAPVLQEGWWGLLGMMSLLSILIAGLAMILFPVLWKE
jgi:heme exporter protein B